MITLESKHSDIITWLQLEFPHWVSSMKNSCHHYDENNLNPYHLEGDIWTHTNMVHKNSEVYSPFNHYVKWSTALHDSGKPASREVVHERKRVRFIGHEGVSAFMVPDFLNKTDMKVEDKIKIFQLVAVHGNLFHHIKVDATIKSDTVDVFKGHKWLLENLTHQVRCDSLGRWYQSDKQNDSLFTSKLPEKFQYIIDQLEDGVPAGNPDAPQLTILVGPPCSRKSTWLKENRGDAVVISRDNLVEAVGEKRGLNYSEAYRLLRENKDIEKAEVNEILNKTIVDARKEAKDVIVDMTNMSKKGRRKFVNDFPKHNAKCIVFVTGYEALLECNKKRGEETGKIIPPGVVLDMCKRFSLPMYNEGFMEIEYIWND